MKVPMNEITVFARRDATIAINANTTRMSYYLAYHMFGSVILKTEAL